MQVKKLLFVSSIMAICCFKKYFTLKDDFGNSRMDTLCVSNLLSTLSLFNLSYGVSSMVYRGHIYEKTLWKKMVWKRVWSLDVTFFKSECKMQKSPNTISMVNINQR